MKNKGGEGEAGESKPKEAGKDGAAEETKA